MENDADPVHRQRARRRRRQGRRAAAVLRRGHLRHRRRAGPRRCAIPGEDLPRLATALPTSSRSTTRTPTASRSGTCPGQRRSRSIGVGNVGAGRGPDARPHGRRAAVHRHPGARARGAGRTPPSPTCTCSPGAARRRPSSPRSSCASWTTRPTCRSSWRPRAWSSTTESQAALSRQQVAADGRRRAQSEWAMREPEPGPHRRIHIHFLENPVEVLGEDGARRRAAHRAAGADRRRHRPRHRRVHRLGRAGGLPGGRLPLGGDRGSAVRHRAAWCCRTTAAGCSTSTARRCPASTRPAGSSAVRSA